MPEEKYCIKFESARVWHVTETTPYLGPEAIYVVVNQSPPKGSESYSKPRTLADVRDYLMERRRTVFSNTAQRCLGVSLEGTTEKIEFEPITIR